MIINTVWTIDSVCDSFPGESQAITIRNALDVIEQVTCVKFERKPSHTGLTRYIDVVNGGG